MSLATILVTGARTGIGSGLVGSLLMRLFPTVLIGHRLAINTIGPLLLFQAAAPVLKASKTGRPVFVAVASMLGTVSGMESLESFQPALALTGPENLR